MCTEDDFKKDPSTLSYTIADHIGFSFIVCLPLLGTLMPFS